VEKLEVESFSGRYKVHDENFTDFLLCYDVDIPVKHIETITLKDFVGCQEIINFSEILLLYLYDSEFRK